MLAWVSEDSPRRLARIAGLIAWITTSAGFAVVVRGKLIVYDDAAATAHNILAHQLQYRLAFTGDIIALLYIVYTLILYKLFKPVNRKLSLLAAVASLMGCGIETFNALFHIAALVVLTSGQSLSAFNVEQLQALALTFLKLHAHGAEIGMVLFGSYNLIIGFLIFRSTFLPRILGVLLAISGACYLFNCFSFFIAPAFEAHLVPYILFPGVAELLLALWLVVMGVNSQRWTEQSNAQRDGQPSAEVPA